MATRATSARAGTKKAAKSAEKQVLAPQLRQAQTATKTCSVRQIGGRMNGLKNTIHYRVDREKKGMWFTGANSTRNIGESFVRVEHLRHKLRKANQKGVTLHILGSCYKVARGTIANAVKILAPPPPVFFETERYRSSPPPRHPFGRESLYGYTPHTSRDRDRW